VASKGSARSTRFRQKSGERQKGKTNARKGKPTTKKAPSNSIKPTKAANFTSVLKHKIKKRNRSQAKRASLSRARKGVAMPQRGKFQKKSGRHGRRRASDNDRLNEET